jgi:hypothetical protein
VGRVIQAKLTVNQPGDSYEQEADRVADQVMRMPDRLTQQPIQRETAPADDELQTKPLAASITPLIQREAMPEEEEVQTKPLASTLQRQEMPEEEEAVQTKPSLQRSTDGSLQAGGNLESRLNIGKGGGSPLLQDVKGFMESRFRTDFSQVKVHTDSEAVQMNQDLNAQAFTHKQDVYFGAGKAPGKDALTAHELTHVVQQVGAMQSNQISNYSPIQMKCSACQNEELGMQKSKLSRSFEEENSLVQRTVGDASDTSGTTVNSEGSLQSEGFAGDPELEAISQGQHRMMAPEKSPAVGRVQTRLDELGYPLSQSPPPTWAPPANGIQSVKVWLNAFIPENVPGKTVPAPSPPSGTMLHGPIPFISDCFQTDNRTFDSAISAPSRMHSEIEIITTGKAPSISFQFHKCHPTHEIDCEDGQLECEKTGDATRMNFSNLTTLSESKFMFSLSGAANNPCATGSPDIDYVGKVIVDLTARTVFFDGFVDLFPAFEMYATSNNGSGTMLFQVMPLPGKDPWNLVGGANRAQVGKARI